MMQKQVHQRRYSPSHIRLIQKNAGDRERSEQGIVFLRSIEMLRLREVWIVSTSKSNKKQLIVISYESW